jgi:hypothetical protein
LGDAAAAADAPAGGIMTPARRTAYERRDVSPRAVVFGVLGLFGMIAVAALVVAGLFQFWPAAPPAPPGPNVPPPRLEGHEGEDRPALEAAAQAKLQGYGWTDRAAGRARIPIERAMELQVQQGWPR